MAAAPRREGHQYCNLPTPQALCAAPVLLPQCPWCDAHSWLQHEKADLQTFAVQSAAAHWSETVNIRNKQYKEKMQQLQQEMVGVTGHVRP